MDFSWTPYFHGFWIFPLLCLLFMAIMMIACRAMPFRTGRGAQRGDRGEQHEAMRRDLNGWKKGPGERQSLE